MRQILHSDINNCYASIECLHRPELRGLPVAVAGSVEDRHGIILAKNYEAKAFGVKTGEAIWQAREKCRTLITIPPNYDLYLRFSRMAREIYARYTNQIEPFGIDEAWLDVTGSVGSGDPAAIADELRNTVKAELGITVSVGVSFNKIFAKLGSDIKKPDAVTVITPENFKEKVWPLPVEDLLFVGRATLGKFKLYGIRTIGMLAQTDETLLKSWLGKIGTVLSAFANGEDRSPVAFEGTHPPIKSIGNSTTLPHDIITEEDAKIALLILSESVCERMRENGFRASTVQLSVRDDKLAHYERQCTLPRATSLSTELQAAALKLLHERWRHDSPIRSIGVRACNLTPGDTPEQISIFDNEEAREKKVHLETAMDSIRDRYGHGSIFRAIALRDAGYRAINPREDHVIHPTGYIR